MDGSCTSPKSMCWARTEFTTSPDVGAVAQQAARALREVFGLGDGDKVFVKMFSSPLRGHTPASPSVQEVREPDDNASELIDPFGGPDGEDPDIFGPDPEVGIDELNGPWDADTEGVAEAALQSGQRPQRPSIAWPRSARNTERSAIRTRSWWATAGI